MTIRAGGRKKRKSAKRMVESCMETLSCGSGMVVKESLWGIVYGGAEIRAWFRSLERSTCDGSFLGHIEVWWLDYALVVCSRLRMDVESQELDSRSSESRDIYCKLYGARLRCYLEDALFLDRQDILSDKHHSTAIVKTLIVA